MCQTTRQGNQPCAKCAYSKHSINYGKQRIFPNYAESAEKYLKPYADEIIMEYIDSYTSGLSMILATYSAFR
ncbi:hypothetical protein HMPREF3107_04710 [Neisseria sp. HMSC31F04]|nr:hypothetical protein HMPREF3107_04710 [Neisseria sp. HMSC31F04]